MTKHTWAVTLILLFTFTYTFPRWADPNQDSRLKAIWAVVNEGTFRIDNYLGDTVDYAKVGDHYYSDKAPGVAFAGIPVYAVLRPLLALPVVDGLVTRLANSPAFAATLNPEGSGVATDKVRFAITQVAVAWVVGVLPSVAVAVLVQKLLLLWGVSARWSAGVALAYGVLTPVFAYANSAYGHQLCAALLLGAFYLTHTLPANPSAGRLLAVGGLLGYAVLTEYPAVPVVAGLWLYAGYRLWQMGVWRRLAWVTVAGAALAGVWMAYNTAIFGGPLNLGYSYSEQWVSQHSTGFVSLGLPTTEALWGMSFGLFRGLFVLAPWLLLSGPGWWAWWHSGEQRAAWWVSALVVGAFVAFNASSVMWWGGFSVGPRYLLPALPWLALAVGWGARVWGSTPAWRLALAGLAVWAWVAVWGMSLAGQAFPPDYPQAVRDNPWLNYVLPQWQADNLARNLGTLLGLRGVPSLLPLLVGWAALAAGWWFKRTSPSHTS